MDTCPVLTEEVANPGEGEAQGRKAVCACVGRRWGFRFCPKSPTLAWHIPPVSFLACPSSPSSW